MCVWGGGVSLFTIGQRGEGLRKDSYSVFVFVVRIN